MDDATIVPNALAATVLIPLGIAVIFYRARIFDAIVRQQRMTGRRAAGLLHRLSGPWWVGAVSLIAAGTGIFILIRFIGEGTRILTTGAAGFDF